jgi:hypothetical protein
VPRDRGVRHSLVTSSTTLSTRNRLPEAI